ncbi:MAG: SLC13 family permease [Ignisphaera sp.]
MLLNMSMFLESPGRLYMIRIAFSSWRAWLGLALIVYLFAVLLLRSRRPSIPVWGVMAFAAFLVVITGLIGFDEIGGVIDMDVVLFLIGMFSIVGLAESSGLLNAISMWVVARCRRLTALVYTLSLLFGILAAFVVNDTVALMGPSIVYSISRAANIDPRPMFLLLAFSLTIGSVATPIGNPQNVLIAIDSGIEAPFITFMKRLFIPTVVNLILTAFLLMKIFKIRDRRIEVILLPQEAIRNRGDAILAGIGLLTSIAALVINDVFELYGLPHITHRGFIPFIVAAGLYILASSPRKMLAGVDWGTIVFFIAMFIAMEGIWRSGILNPILNILIAQKIDGFKGIVVITIASLLLSQLLSNVPFVKLFINYMKNIGYTNSNVDAWLALAMSSTIAGNLTILGAASNIIILEVLESRMGTTITFAEFFKIGSIVTIANTIIYLLFFII